MPTSSQTFRPQFEKWPGVIIDVPEEQIIPQLALADEIANKLRPLDVNLAIDNFGRGYSSLARAKICHSAELKLDRSFVTDCGSDKVNARLCKTVIDLAHGFGSIAVGVGIQKASDALALVSMGCDYGQGFLLGEPMPEQRLVSLLRQRASIAGPEAFDRALGDRPRRPPLSASVRGASMRPGFAARIGEIVRVGDPLPDRRLGFEHQMRDAVSLAITRPPLPWCRSASALPASCRRRSSSPSAVRPCAAARARSREPTLWFWPDPIASRCVLACRCGRSSNSSPTVCLRQSLGATAASYRFCGLGKDASRSEREDKWSGQQDLNLRPAVPKTAALPGCAIPRPARRWIHVSPARSKA